MSDRQEVQDRGNTLAAAVPCCPNVSNGFDRHRCLLAPGHSGWHMALGSTWSRHEPEEDET